MLPLEQDQGRKEKESQANEENRLLLRFPDDHTQEVRAINGNDPTLSIDNDCKQKIEVGAG